MDIRLQSIATLLTIASICYCRHTSHSFETADTALLCYNEKIDKDKKITNPLYYNLEEVHVEACESLKSKSATSVISSSKKDIEHQLPLNVSAVLQHFSGFTMKDNYQSPITLRGMSGKRILTLRNGLRRMSSYPAGYMAHLVNVYDLERIEVEKGYSSAIYGAGAIAGTINLIDKPLFTHQGFNSKIAYGYASNNKENTILACSGWNNNKYAIKGGLRYRKADDFNYANGEKAINSAYQDQDFFMSTGVKLANNGSLSFSGDWHNGGPWGKAVGFNGSDYMKINTLKELSHNYQVHYDKRNAKNTAHYELKGFYSNEERSLQKAYYTAANYQLSYIETTHYANAYYGTKAQVELKLSTPHKLTLGSDAYAYQISTPSDGTDYIQGLSFSNRISKNARLYQGALYAEHQYNINAKLKLSGGARYDHTMMYEGEVYDTTATSEDSQSKGALSAHLALHYRHKASLYKVNIAQAFRMPSINEMYTDSYTANGIIYASPELKAEYSKSLDLVYRYFSECYTIELSPFVWLIDNMIKKEELRGLPGTNYRLMNIGQAFITGGEVTLSITLSKYLPIKDKIKLDCGLAYMYGNDISNRENIETLSYVPPFNLKAALHYHRDIKEKTSLAFSLRSTYYSKQQRRLPDSYITDSYLIFSSNISLQFKAIPMRPSLNITINNLSNKSYYSYQSYLPSPGRNSKLMLSLHF